MNLEFYAELFSLSHREQNELAREVKPGKDFDRLVCFALSTWREFLQFGIKESECREILTLEALNLLEKRMVPRRRKQLVAAFGLCLVDHVSGLIGEMEMEERQHVALN